MKTHIYNLIMALVLLPAWMTAQNSIGIVSHRGFHKFEGSAENSISSMQHAVDHDFEGTEFDVQLTLDGQAIVFHDGKMSGRVIAETPYDTLRRLPAFTLKSGEAVPILDEFMAACSVALRQQRFRGKHTTLFFEVKPHARQEQRLQLIGQIVEAIGKYGLHDDLFFISFDLEACELLARLLPDIPVAYLEGDLSPEELQSKGIVGLDYHYSVIAEHPQWVEEAHRLGMTVNVWTVNKPEVARQMLGLGVDYLTTDRPLEMREWISVQD